MALPVALPQVKVGNISENQLSEICQAIQYLLRKKYTIAHYNEFNAVIIQL